MSYLKSPFDKGDYNYKKVPFTPNFAKKTTIKGLICLGPGSDKGMIIASKRSDKTLIYPW